MNYSNYNNHILKNINPLYFWEPFDRDFSGFQESFKGVIKLIGLNIISSLKNYKKIKNHEIPKIEKEVVFSYNKKLKKDVLSQLKVHLTDRSEITPDPKLLEDKPFIDIYIGFLGLRYALHHCVWYFSFKGYERQAYRNKFWHCYYDLGRYQYMLKQLKKSKKVKCFVGTNDHIGSDRIGFVISEKLGIKSVYIQHASVTKDFPPLMVDLALLDGQNAKEKYKIAPNKKVQIELIGSPKYDNALNDPKLHNVSDLIGICVNMNTQEHDNIFALCEQLNNLDLKFIIRFHPHLTSKHTTQFIKSKWLYSDPKVETESDFILRCGKVVSGDSNILLDSIVLYRRPIYFAPSKLASDYYGFLNNGVIDKHYDCIEDVIAEVKNSNYDIPAGRQKAKFYINTINSEFEGRSNELALKHINELINSN